MKRSFPKGKEERSLYIDEVLATEIDRRADKDRRSFSFKAVELLRLGITLEDEMSANKT